MEAGKYLYCDGSIFDAAKYPKLYAILGINQLPDLRGRFLEGNDLGGQIIEAGLPNIVGKINFFKSWELILGYSGALEAAPDNNTDDLSGHNSLRISSAYHHITIDASRCSSIYGKSNTVQPPAVTVRYYIRAK